MTDSVGGLVIPQEILVRSETYVFSVTLVQKDYKKMFTFLYCTVAIEMVPVLWCHNSHRHKHFDDVRKWCFIYHSKENLILI